MNEKMLASLKPSARLEALEAACREVRRSAGGRLAGPVLEAAVARLQAETEATIPGWWSPEIGSLARIWLDGEGDRLQAFLNVQGDPCTDVANADRLVKHLAGKARYVTPWKRWIFFDGTRWIPDLKDEIKNSATMAASGVYAEASTATTKELREKLATWAVRSESLQRLEAMIDLAGSRPGIPALPEELDANPWLLNCPNGTIDLRTGELKPHKSEDLLTKMAGADYQPDAGCERWRTFLTEIFAGDESMAEFTQRAVGASITGDPREEVFLLLHGVGANGKTTLIEAVARALGDYAQASEFSTFLEARRRDNIRNDIAALRGARFVSASEPPSGARLDEGVVKQITSRDRIRARFLYQESFEFKRSWMIWLAANHKPEVRGTDHGIWRRIRLLPFTVKFMKPGEPTSPPYLLPGDDKLAEKLQAELPGILAWAVAGCLAWQREGLGEAGAVTEATAGYREEQDKLAQFIGEKCLLDQTVKARAGDLFKAYVEWCEANREEFLTQTAFGLRLGELGLVREHSGCKWWRGIGLRVENPSGRDQ
ncbi:MAG: hypothetical protein HY717_23410 [Planctomycetes bacterium]|nr:hypothetical protein [Planctomycetota bacterium]